MHTLQASSLGLASGQRISLTTTSFRLLDRLPSMPCSHSLNQNQLDRSWSCEPGPGNRKSMTQKSSTIKDDGGRRDSTEEKIINHHQERGCRQHDRWHLEGTPALQHRHLGSFEAGPSYPGVAALSRESTPRSQPASTGPMSFPAEEPLQGSHEPNEAGCHARQPLPIPSLRSVMYFHAFSLSRLSSLASLTSQPSPLHTR